MTYLITSATGTQFSVEAETQADAIRQHTTRYPFEGIARIERQADAATREQMTADSD